MELRDDTLVLGQVSQVHVYEVTECLRRVGRVVVQLDPELPVPLWCDGGTALSLGLTSLSVEMG